MKTKDEVKKEAGERLARFKALVAEGWTRKQIAEAEGISHQRVCQVLQRVGHKVLRPRKKTN